MEFKLEAAQFELPGEIGRVEDEIARIQERYRYKTKLQDELERAYDTKSNPLELAELRSQIDRIKAERAVLNEELLGWEKRHRELRPAESQDGADKGDTEEGTWGLRRIGVPRVWEEFGVRGEGATVAVIGTGVDLNVAGLGERLLMYRPNASSTSTEPDRGTGTQAASTAVGGTDEDGIPLGVAPAAGLLVADLFSSGASATDVDLFLGMQWAIENGADVILITPWTSGAPSDIWDSMAVNCLALGVTVIAHSGRFGTGTVTSPGNAEHVLTVGALGPGDRIAALSGGGVVGPPLTDEELGRRGGIEARYVKPDLCAPGVDVRAAVPGAQPTRTSGPHAAAAHVAGVLALMVSAWKSNADGRTEGRYFNDIIETVDSLGEIGKDVRYGEGVVNAHRAVARMLGKEGG